VLSGLIFSSLLLNSPYVAFDCPSLAARLYDHLHSQALRLAPPTVETDFPSLED
jgi:hypothetical protein